MVEYTESDRSERAQFSQGVCQPVHQRAPQSLRASMLRAALVSITGLMLGLGLVAPVQAQKLGPVLSSIGGLTPPEKATGQAVETLCPELSPDQTAGGVGDLQIRCTELVGNALGRNPSAVRNPLLAMAPEEIAAQGTRAIETSNRQIGARLAALHGGLTALRFGRVSLRLDEPVAPGTLVASLAPIAAVSSAVPGSAPGASSRLGVFATGTYTYGDKDATSRAAGFDAHTWEGTLGADYRVTNNFVLGLAFNYMSTKAYFDTITVLGTPSGGGVDIRSVGLSIYSTYYVADKFYVDGIVSLGWSDYDTDRRILYSVPSTSRAGGSIPGVTSVNQTAQGDTDGSQVSFSFGAGYDVNIGGWTISPLARLEYMKLDIDGYRERINNTAAGFGLTLAFEDQTVESLVNVLGTQASYAISTGFGVLLPQVRVEWRHEFKNDRRTITARFINDPTRTPLVLVTDNPDRDYFNLGTGLSGTFRGGVSAFVYYETILGLADVSVHTVSLGVRLEF